jgi:hypothetical protein
MPVELFGFTAGAGLVCGVGLVLIRHELWKAIASAYGSRGARRDRGNALIWPSH